jgi:hypothetical protein
MDPKIGCCISRLFLLLPGVLDDEESDSNDSKLRHDDVMKKSISAEIVLSENVSFFNFRISDADGGVI